jgi:engulfment/cell motility protein 1
VSPQLIKRRLDGVHYNSQQVVELIVMHPLVNILRGAMSILVAIVSHPHTSGSVGGSYNGPFGFRALKPVIAIHSQFLEMLVSRLSSADHALCANSLQLINSLVRDAIMNDSDSEWPRFIKRLQDLGVFKAVFVSSNCEKVQIWDCS